MRKLISFVLMIGLVCFFEVSSAGMFDTLEQALSTAERVKELVSKPTPQEQPPPPEEVENLPLVAPKQNKELIKTKEQSTIEQDEDWRRQRRLEQEKAWQKDRDQSDELERRRNEYQEKIKQKRIEQEKEQKRIEQEIKFVLKGTAKNLIGAWDLDVESTKQKMKGKDIPRSQILHFRKIDTIFIGFNDVGGFGREIKYLDGRKGILRGKYTTKNIGKNKILITSLEPYYSVEARRMQYIRRKWTATFMSNDSFFLKANTKIPWVFVKDLSD